MQILRTPISPRVADLSVFTTSPDDGIVVGEEAIMIKEEEHAS